MGHIADVIAGRPSRVSVLRLSVATDMNGVGVLADAVESKVLVSMVSGRMVNADDSVAAL